MAIEYVHRLFRNVIDNTCTLMKNVSALTVGQIFCTHIDTMYTLLNVNLNVH